jgi:predicted RNA-binding protein with PIN domain
MKRAKWPRSPRAYRWLVDGHNAIFANSRLESLQTSGKKAEARRRLEQIFERFAAAFGVEVVIVYDGRGIRKRSVDRGSTRVRAEFSRPPEDADERILARAAETDRSGKKVAVVTSDRALGERLPPGAIRVDPAEVDSRLRRASLRRERSMPRGDFRDIEEFFLSHDPPRSGPQAEIGRPKKGRDRGSR